MNHFHPEYLSDLSKALDSVSGLEALKDSTIMITGATGLVGMCLTQMLAMAN